MMKIALIATMAACAATPLYADHGHGQDGRVHPQASRLWDQLQAKYDTDDDDTISADEFAAAVEAAADKLKDAVLDKYDTDDDGSISTEELQAKFDEEAAKWLDRLLDIFDRNDD